MLLFDRHRRFRERLSGYIDGQVNGREKAALETHLASCKRCRTELAQLHSVRTILRSLPPVQAPRSFRLTPQQVATVARPRPIAASPALNNAVRLAGAVAAVALTIVVFADRSDVFESGTTNEASRPAGNAEMLSQATDKAARENATNGGAAATVGGSAGTSAPQPPLATGAPLSTTADQNAAVPAPATPTVPAGAAGGAAPSAAFGQPSVAPPPPATPLAGARAAASPSPALQNLDSDQGQQAAPPASASPSSGSSAVRIIEALLAAVLGIAIGGTLVLTAARRLGQ